MITMRDFGNNGRLANQLFQYASLLGIANKYDKELHLKSWHYSDYFIGRFPINHISKINVNYEELNFHFDNIDIKKNENMNLEGYFKSEKYWEHCKEIIREKLTFTNNFIYIVNKQFEYKNGNILGKKPLIGIHIRKGDYINNPNYYQLPIHYYIQALKENFNNYESDYNIIFFSDDIEYCKLHFSCLFNAYFSENNSDIEDLCLMSQCENLILSNSSYSWWGAYLGVNKIKVIRPNYLFDGDLKEINNDKDFWIKDWIKFDHVNKKIDLSDVTFTIPISYDHNDRKQNLHLCLKILFKNCNINVIIIEQGGNKFNYLNGSIVNVMYLLFHSKEFHRTKMLNQMALKAITPIIANWDTDVFIPPMQLLKAVQQIRDGNDMVYPYDKKFVRMKRLKWYDILNKTKDIGNFDNTEKQGDESLVTSVGGAVLFNKKSFIEGGMENENFISYGAEDQERYERFTKLGFKVSRISGNIYHLDHFIGVNSSKKNPYFRWNEFEFIKVKLMDKEQLIEYITTWKWIQKLKIW